MLEKFIPMFIIALMLSLFACTAQNSTEPNNNSSLLIYPPPSNGQTGENGYPISAPSEEARATAQAWYESLPKPTRKPISTRRTGVINSREEVERLPPRGIEIGDLWQGYINEQFVKVYVGRELPNYMAELNPEERHFGLVHVIWYGDSVVIQRVKTRYETGLLHIEEVAGNRLVLISDGFEDREPEKLYFDIEAAQFVSSLDEIVLPVLTPQATSYP
ncbi:MAG TPA: hypothetical protein VLL52_13265 [Anaerolineae bacterium]|nr:hypothetical protein [Anaerolineae bacterium]